MKAFAVPQVSLLLSQVSYMKRDSDESTESNRADRGRRHGPTNFVSECRYRKSETFEYCLSASVAFPLPGHLHSLHNPGGWSGGE